MADGWRHGSSSWSAGDDVGHSVGGDGLDGRDGGGIAAAQPVETGRGGARAEDEQERPCHQYRPVDQALDDRVKKAPASLLHSSLGSYRENSNTPHASETTGC